jgi:hypothetical protein
MKTIIRLLVLLSLAIGSARAADHLVIVPARGLSQTNAKAILAEVVTAATDRLPVGTRVWVVDPVALDLLATVTVPSGTKAQRERNVPFAKQIAPLRAALLGLAPSQSWENATLRVPEVLRFLAEQVVPRGEKATVLFIGSPLYRGSSGVFDFSNGVVPSDGWLFASAEDSPFSTAGISCKDWSIHIATTQSVWADSEWQAKEVQRFWSAFINSTGGRLVTLAPLSVSWERVRQGVADPLGFRPVDTADRVLVWRKRFFIRGQESESTIKSNDMTEVVEPVAPPGITVAVPETEVAVIPTPTPAPEPSPATPHPVVVETVVAAVTPEKTEPAPTTSLTVKAAELPSVTPDRIGIGLVWETDKGHSDGCDLDLWVKVRGEAECNYKRMRVGPAARPLVRLYDDIRKAKGLTNKPVFEFVEVSQPVLPGEVEVWINLFQNSGRRPIRGLVQVEYQGRKYTQTIEFTAMSGDRAGNANKRGQSDRWIRLDLAKITRQPGTT